MAIRSRASIALFSRLLTARCGCRLKTKIKFPPKACLLSGSPRKFGQTHGEVKLPFLVRPCFGLIRRASLRINFALIMNKIPQRILDYDIIKGLCKFSSLDKCPLVFKTCNPDNCPLFFIVTLDDCDYAAECLTNDVF